MLIIKLTLFLCCILLFNGQTQAESKRLICEPEGNDKNKNKEGIDDEMIKAINALIDSKMKEVEERVEERIWKRMMDVSEKTTPVVVAESKEEQLCHFKYEDKCFAFFHAEVMNIKEAERRCSDIGGHMANIYSKLHEDLIVDYVRKIEMVPIFFFIGMKINTRTMKVSQHDGSPASYVHWYPDGGYPQKPHRLIRYTILPTFYGMFNNVAARDAKSNGVLCEL